MVRRGCTAALTLIQHEQAQNSLTLEPFQQYVFRVTGPKYNPRPVSQYSFNLN